MRQPAALFPIVLALGATILLPGPGAQAAPIPIKACQTISQPGSYVLENNLTSTGDCIVITASFVTINLAGFAITGSGGGGGIKAGTGPLPPPGSPLLSGFQFVGLAVRNGSISNFAVGVLFDAADGSIVEGLRVQNGDGIRAKGIVRKNIAFGQHELTTLIVASGIVTDNYTSGFSRGTGISADGTVRGNTALGAAIGIEVSPGSTVIGNTAMDNQLVGIRAGCPSNLTDNTAVGNGTNLSAGPDCHNEDNVAP